MSSDSLITVNMDEDFYFHMRSVYDAAMALSLGDLNEIAIALDSRGDDEIAHRVCNLAEAIERAEEVERG